MAMAAHHMDIDWPSLEAMIVQAADAISAARPGARRDILESYVKRLEKLEGIADSFKGVSKSFALQAGREIRIMVESEKISDEEAVWLSKDIARRIENELEYPGPDQGDRHPRDPRGRLRESDGCLGTATPSATLTERELIARIRRGSARSRLDAWGSATMRPSWSRSGTARCSRRRARRRRALRSRFMPPDAIGHRALAVNLSDLAAMGAAPRLALLSLVLPPALPLADFDGMIDGLVHSRHGSSDVAGGNLTRSPGPLVVDVTVIGTVNRRKVLTRGGARPGDGLYVSGTIGAATAGLEQSLAAPDAPPDTAPRRWYLRPQPRTRLGRELGRAQVASACMDLSDGLADALEQVAEASGVSIRNQSGAAG